MQYPQYRIDASTTAQPVMAQEPNSTDATRLPADGVLSDIAEYVLDYQVRSDEAEATAWLALMDALGCAFYSLGNAQCTRALGPVVPGATLDGGAAGAGGALPARPRQRGEMAYPSALTAPGWGVQDTLLRRGATSTMAAPRSAWRLPIPSATGDAATRRWCHSRKNAAAAWKLFCQRIDVTN